VRKKKKEKEKEKEKENFSKVKKDCGNNSRNIMVLELIKWG